MTYSLPYSFGPGEVARPQEVNANFNAIINQLEEINTSKADIDLSNITSDGIDNIKNTSLSKNIGEIVFSTIPLNDSGLHLLDGSLLDLDGIYSDFCKYIRKLYYENNSANYFTTETNWQNSVSSYGECGKFVYDSENNTVRLPKINGILEGITDDSIIGNLVQAGLPNISAKIDKTDFTTPFSNTNSFTTSGAFSGIYTTTAKSFSDTSASGTRLTGLKFNASNSNSIYGNSSTVQPQTIKYLIYIVVASSVKTDFQVDLDNITTDLNMKADNDLSNTTDSGKILMSGMSMPSGTFVNLTLGASGATYTAPANGWIYFNKTSNASGQYITIQNSTKGYSSRAFGSTSNATLIKLFPVGKNDNFVVSYTTGGATNNFKFFYAQGSESEA